MWEKPRFFFSSLSLHARVDRARTVESANQFMRQTALRAFVEKDTRERTVKKKSITKKKTYVLRRTEKLIVDEDFKRE